MSKRSLVVLGALLIVLAAAAVSMFQRGQRHASERKLWPGGDSAPVQKVLLTGPAGRLGLEKRGGQWEVVEPIAYPAQAQLVQSVFEKLSKAVLSEPLTESASKHGLFGLEAATAIRVEIAGSVPLDFWAGKAGPDYDSLYARLGGSPGVFEVRGLSRYDLERSSVEWLSKAILRVPVESLQALVIKSTVTLSLIRGMGGSWEIEGQKLSVSTALGSPMNIIQGYLYALDADQILLPPFPASGRPVLEIRARGSSRGKTEESVITAYTEKGGLVPVVKRGEERVRFAVYPWRLDPFQKPAAEFVKP